MDDDLTNLLGPAGGGVSSTAIDEAERKLGLKLPPPFRWWLSGYGGGQIGSDILYGLDEPRDGRPDLVQLAMKNEMKGRSDLKRLVFMIGNEEHFFFDTSRPDAGGEYPVYLWDAIQGDSSLYAASFADFLRRRIEEMGNS